MPWPESGPEILRLLGLLRFLGAPPHTDTSLELPVANKEWTAWGRLAARHRLVAGGFICVHPGARLPSRRWPLERFATVACRLSQEGWPVVVTGSRDERPLAHALCRAIAARGGRCIDLAGETDLGVLAALLSECRLLICNDTGVSHVAAAVRAPSVVVASGSDPHRWAPLDAVRHRVLAHDVECRPCAHVECPIGHPCALGVTVDMVAGAAAKQLEAGRDWSAHHAA
jgi:ADP-heptose:LPS heptosyltransferase